MAIDNRKRCKYHSERTFKVHELEAGGTRLLRKGSARGWVRHTSTGDAMGDAPVPMHDSTLPVYPDGPDQAEQRYAQLAAAFEKRYEAKPSCFARAPGRVNLIGEHVDYEGYGVLPMAIRQDTVVAIRKGGERLVIANLHADAYPEASFTVDPEQEVDTGNHSWANYFLAAYKGVFEFFKAKGHALSPVGLQIMVHGTVPQGAGVSSSAAFVCSSALAVIAAYGVSATKAEVAEFACTCERYVGTQSGGMDQAISMMGMPGVAQLINFHPVRAEEVDLPEEAVFVIGNSLTESQKAVTADVKYNLRVVECRLAAIVLAIALGKSQEGARKLTTLRELEPLFSESSDGTNSVPSAGDATSAVAAVQKHLHAGAYERSEIEDLIGQDLDSLYADHQHALKVLTAAASAGAYRLRDRAQHVYQEAALVPRFRGVCNDGALDADAKLAALAELMDASHASCRDLYQCSCEELDSLVRAAKAAGALGSRLTGAGWGGCTVSLVRQDGVDNFIAKVKQDYYEPLVAAGRVKDDQWGDILFASKPASGGAILKLNL